MFLIFYGFISPLHIQVLLRLLLKVLLVFLAKQQNRVKRFHLKRMRKRMTQRKMNKAIRVKGKERECTVNY